MFASDLKEIYYQNNFNSAVEELEDVAVEELTDEGTVNELIVYNDAPMNILKPLRSELVNRGLSAVIESRD